MLLGGQIIFDASPLGGSITYTTSSLGGFNLDFINRFKGIYNSIPRNYALALAFCMHCTAVHATYRTRSARRAPNGRSGGEPPE